MSPPHTSSFEALLHSYGNRIYDAMPSLDAQFGGPFTSTVEGVETALESAADWLLGESLSAIWSWDKTVGEMDLGGEVRKIRSRIGEEMLITDFTFSVFIGSSHLPSECQEPCCLF